MNLIPFKTMQTPPSDPNPDRGNANIDTIRNVSQLVATAHRNLVIASSFCNHPAFGDRYHDTACELKGAIKAAALALGATIEQLVAIENQLFSERNNNDPN